MAFGHCHAFGSEHAKVAGKQDSKEMTGLRIPRLKVVALKGVISGVQCFLYALHRERCHACCGVGHHSGLAFVYARPEAPTFQSMSINIWASNYYDLVEQLRTAPCVREVQFTNGTAADPAQQLLNAASGATPTQQDTMKHQRIVRLPFGSTCSAMLAHMPEPALCRPAQVFTCCLAHSC